MSLICLAKPQRYDLLTRVLILLICSEDRHDIPIQGEHRGYGLLKLHGRPGLDSVQVILGHEAS